VVCITAAQETVTEVPASEMLLYQIPKSGEVTLGLGNGIGWKNLKCIIERPALS
jgi:hypothetical protein